MEFKCKCCETMNEAISFDAIVATGKLCNKCFKLNDKGRERIRKALYAKTHEFEKVDLSRKKPPTRKNKGYVKKKRKFTFICNNCGKDSGRDYKPYMCDGEDCRSMSFFRKEV